MPVYPTTLFQLVLPSTSPVKVYTPPGYVRLELLNIHNTDVAGATVSIFHDMDGSVYDDHSKLVHQLSVGIDATTKYDTRLLLELGSTLALQASIADKITVTGYGWVDITEPLLEGPGAVA